MATYTFIVSFLDGRKDEVIYESGDLETCKLKAENRAKFMGGQISWFVQI